MLDERVGVLLRAVSVAAIVADRPDVFGRVAVHAQENIGVETIRTRPPAIVAVNALLE